jgi:RNA polymerase sigma factor (sigma-70 family)
MSQKNYPKRLKKKHDKKLRVIFLNFLFTFFCFFLPKDVKYQHIIGQQALSCAEPYLTVILIAVNQSGVFVLQGGLQRLLEVFERSGPELHTLLMRLTLRKDIAEELMQELFVKLANFGGLDKVKNLAAYAHKTAVNMAFDWRKTKGKYPCQLDDAPEPVSGLISPLDKLSLNEEIEDVLCAISQLRGASREAFVMRYIQQQDYECIAGEMGKTPHQVRALCFKALMHIRYVLSDKELRYSKKGGHDAED